MNIPIVIAVHQHTPILDEVASEFTQIFYSMIVKGTTTREAFNVARNYIKNKGSEIDKFSCCCNHTHYKCKWLDY